MNPKLEKRRRRRRLKIAFLCLGRRLLALLLCFVMCLTLLPLEYAKVLKILREGLPAVPFFHIGKVSVTPMAKMFNDSFTFLANIIMFMPFGFCPALLWRRSRWYKALGIGLLISENIECWQLFIGRTFDVDDLILNLIGVMLGWLLWLVLRKPTLTCEER